VPKPEANVRTKAWFAGAGIAAVSGFAIIPPLGANTASPLGMFPCIRWLQLGREMPLCQSHYIFCNVSVRFIILAEDQCSYDLER